eukprot:6213213-Pleurochrysis_carterae.AAC.2
MRRRANVNRELGHSRKREAANTLIGKLLTHSQHTHTHITLRQARTRKSGNQLSCASIKLCREIDKGGGDERKMQTRGAHSSTLRYTRAHQLTSAQSHVRRRAHASTLKTRVISHAHSSGTARSRADARAPCHTRGRMQTRI